jgi:hypothetical protein
MGSASGDEDAFPDEYPQHQVTLGPFALAQFPVTQGLWGSVLARARVQGIDPKEQGVPDNPSRFRGANRPVEQVNWHEARSFCSLLNEVLQLPPNHFRLPSEAEWEYAARAGKPTHSYAGSNQLEEVGWYRGNNSKATAPVGLLAPNAFGLYDLSGNVWEWCEDDWHGGYDNAPDDGSAWVDDPDTRAGVRVRRGGSWLDSPQVLPLCLPRRVLAGRPRHDVRRLPPRRSSQVKREPVSRCEPTEGEPGPARSRRGKALPGGWGSEIFLVPGARSGSSSRWRIHMAFFAILTRELISSHPHYVPPGII